MWRQQSCCACLFSLMFHGMFNDIFQERGTRHSARSCLFAFDACGVCDVSVCVRVFFECVLACARARRACVRATRYRWPTGLVGTATTKLAQSPP